MLGGLEMRFQFTRSLGMIALSILLIIWGLQAFIPAIAGIAGISVFLSILAIVAGVLILLSL